MACLVQKNTPLTLTDWTRSHSASVISCVGLLTPAIPALLTRMSSFPKCATTSSSVRFTSASLATLHRHQAAFRPLAVNAAARATPSSSRTSRMATAAPSSAIRSAVALPSPTAPPVITATLLASLFMVRLRAEGRYSGGRQL